VVALTDCARSQEASVRDAIAAKFPDGPRRCLGLAGDIVGVHLPAVAGANWFPSTGPTLPLRHAFLFYAAPAADPVPELVGELASAAGVLHRTTFDWTVDTETSGPGPEVVGATGYRYRPNVFHHELAVTPVALYETEPQSAEFDYHTEFDNSDPPSWMAAPAFRRAAVGPSTEPIDQLRRVVVAFEPTRDGTLKYVTGVRPP
jgi:hypothetical protein